VAHGSSCPSRTINTSHDPALVVMGEQDPDFPDPRAESPRVLGGYPERVIML
jgi:hypothetical protein